MDGLLMAAVKAILCFHWLPITTRESRTIFNLNLVVLVWEYMHMNDIKLPSVSTILKYLSASNCNIRRNLLWTTSCTYYHIILSLAIGKADTEIHVYLEEN